MEIKGIQAYKKLLAIQEILNCPKSQWNKFGGFWFRNLEDILIGLKPLLKEHNSTVVIGDDIVQKEHRFYVKATATFVDLDSGEMVTNTAFAREAEQKKGMGSDMLTGSTSSYARKYCMNGLFLIDDNKDNDDEQEGNKGSNKKEESADPIVTPEQADHALEIINKYGVDHEAIAKRFGIESLNELKYSQYTTMVKGLKAKHEKKKES